MTRTRAVILALALALPLAACASAGTGAATRRNPNQLTAEDLAAPHIASLSLMEAIQRLRPNWLRARGATSIMGAGDQLPGLMINQSPQPLDALQGLRATDVTTVEYMSGADATTLYGTGYVNGVIRVSTAGRTGR